MNYRKKMIAFKIDKKNILKKLFNKSKYLDYIEYLLIKKEKI